MQYKWCSTNRTIDIWVEWSRLPPCRGAQPKNYSLSLDRTNDIVVTMAWCLQVSVVFSFLIFEYLVVNYMDLSNKSGGDSVKLNNMSLLFRCLFISSFFLTGFKHSMSKTHTGFLGIFWYKMYCKNIGYVTYKYWEISFCGGVFLVPTSMTKK